MTDAFFDHMADCEWCLHGAPCLDGYRLIEQERGDTADCHIEQLADRILGALAT